MRLISFVEWSDDYIESFVTKFSNNKSKFRATLIKRAYVTDKIIIKMTKSNFTQQCSENLWPLILSQLYIYVDR